MSMVNKFNLDDRRGSFRHISCTSAIAAYVDSGYV